MDQSLELGSKRAPWMATLIRYAGTQLSVLLGEI
jgi:hypothetical protein